MLATLTNATWWQFGQSVDFRRFYKTGTAVAKQAARHKPWFGKEIQMFDRRFFASNVGLTAVASMAAMVAFNIFAITHQMNSRPAAAIAAAPIVELA